MHAPLTWQGATCIISIHPPHGVTRLVRGSRGGVTPTVVTPLLLHSLCCCRADAVPPTASTTTLRVSLSLLAAYAPLQLSHAYQATLLGIHALVVPMVSRSGLHAAHITMCSKTYSIAVLQQWRCHRFPVLSSLPCCNRLRLSSYYHRALHLHCSILQSALSEGMAMTCSSSCWERCLHTTQAAGISGLESVSSPTAQGGRRGSQRG